MSTEKHTEVWVVPGHQIIHKESKQVKPDSTSGLQVVNPRVDFNDLLYFMDVNVWHKRSVKLKAALVGGLGWQLVTDDENKDPDDAYNRIMELLERPNEKYQETFSVLMVRMLTDYFALGNGWLEVSRNTKGEVAAIYHVRGKNVRRKKDFTGYFQIRANKKQEFRNFGDTTNKTKNELIHFYEYDPQDDYYGIPEWLPAMATMAMDRAAVEFNTYIFDNGMMIPFAIIIEGGRLSAKARKALQQFLQKNYKGIANAGRAIVIDNDDPNVKIRIEKLDNPSMRDMSFYRLRTLSRDEVIAAHQVPPRLVGIMSAGQLGGTGEVSGQLKIFQETLIKPEQRKLENILNRTILATFGEHKWKIKFNELDITDPKDDAEWYKTMVEIGVLEADEVREEIGYKPRQTPVQPEVTMKQIAKALEGIRKVLED